MFEHRADIGSQLFDNGAGNDDVGMRLPRFRKRDKMLFYGRRMLRKVKNVSAQAYGGQGRKRRAVMRFAKRILQLKREHVPMQLKTVEPPSEYLEEMITDAGDRVPPDALYMLQGIRIFGHFEKPIFLKLCRHTEIISLQTNDLLFKIGDIDDSVFIVQSGELNVLINNADGTTLSLKHVKEGESVTSLLSFIDVLVGNNSVYKSVTAKAVRPSQVIRLPMRAFKDVFDESPDILIRVIQVIMIRLQRVTFTALRNYLGLHSELVQNRPKRNSVVCKTSPMHHRQRPTTAAAAAAGGIGFVAPPTAAHQPTVTPATPMDPNYVHSLSSEAAAFDTLRADVPADASDVTSAKPNHPHATDHQFADVIDEPSLYDQALEGFRRELGITEAERMLFDGHVELRDVADGVTLLTEGKNDEVGLVYVLSGNLSVLQQATTVSGASKKPTADSSTEVYSHSSYAGEVIGGLAVLTGESSLYTVRAKLFSRVAMLKRSSVYK